MRCKVAAMAFACCLCCAPAHAGRASADLHFDGDRYRAEAIEAQAGKVRAAPAKSSWREARKRGARDRKPPARVAVVVRPAKPRAVVTVPVAPLDAPERSPAMMLLGRFVGEVLSAFGSIDVAARIPNPARDDVFARPPVFDRPRTLAAYLGEFRPLKSLAGFPVPLQKMVATLQSECGARITAAYRPGARVAGSGRPSLHASKKAVDLQARNPSCLYATLKRARYAGGWSTDYRAVNHLHMSWGGREHGRRFAHYSGSRSYRIRVASR